ncbi:MAG: ATP-binding protein [Gammaproteobacteria bacterium]|nr:ATP-binding protein [Gammaproteobacteria bacterium]
MRDNGKTRQSYDRWQEKKVLQALGTRRVLILAGCRQCGKTTLSRSLASAGSIYRTLDDPTLMAAAQSDPAGFVAHADELMIIDEIQRVPALLQAIKRNVDDNQNPGRFLLTGSANIQSLPGVTESLAGRVRKLRLRPLTQGELLGNQPHFIQAAFREEFTAFSLDHENLQGPVFDQDFYITQALKGGYPEALRLESEREIRQWHKDYVESLIERDLRDIINIRRKDSMLKLLEILAAWSSNYMDVAKIGAGLALQRPALESYINALETLYLVERVPAWTRTDYDRVGKRDKILMTDSGLMSSILNWRHERVRLDGKLYGKLLETYVFTQLAAILDAQDEDYSLFHYRDREKREIDFLVENENGDLLGLEVKAASAISKDSFKHLEWFKANMAGERRFTGVVLYTGEHIVSFGLGLWAVPISSLWH